MPSVAERRSRHENIYLAASDNDIAGVTHFLDLGADINALDGNGYSLMHAASSYNHFELLRFLVSRGGNVNLPDFEGDTPLYVAETREMCALLIHLGADVAHQNEEGKNVIEYMIEEDEFPDVIAYLTSLPQTGGAHARDGQDFSHVSVRYAAPNGVHDETRRDGQQETHAAEEDESAAMMEGLPQEAREKIWQVIGDSARDGVNRDEELRSILSEALLGRGIVDGGGSARQRTE